MKKSFSLMEVIIASSLLAVVMLSLYKSEANSIFLFEKTKKSKKEKAILNIVEDSNSYSKRNENIYVDKYFSINDDDLRKEFKEYKIKIKDELIDEKQVEIDRIKIEINKFKTNYSLEDGISKNIYKFELKL